MKFFLYPNTDYGQFHVLPYDAAVCKTRFRAGTLELTVNSGKTHVHTSQDRTILSCDYVLISNLMKISVSMSLNLPHTPIHPSI